LGGGEDQYLAGLWRSTLVVDLLWRSEDPRKSWRLPGQYAPTWSWTSITGPVYYDEAVETLVENGPPKGFSVIDVAVDSTGAPTVLVGSGCLVEMAMHSDYSPFRKVLRPVGAPVDIELAVAWDYTAPYQNHGAETVEEATFVFAMFGIRPGRKGPYGILLRPFGQEGQFQRAGYVSGYRQETRHRRWGSDGWLEEQVEPQQGEGASWVWEEWAREVLGSQQRRVEIV